MAEIEELTKEEIDALLEKAVDQFNDELYAEAAATTRPVLEHSVSRWQRIYAVALLADCLDDWYDAEEQRYMAETMYSNTHFLWPPKKNAVVDRKLQELRDTLDELKDQRACRPLDLRYYDKFMLRMYQKHSRVIEAEGEWNEMLQKRSQEYLERQQAEIEDYDAQKRAEDKERKARERDKVQEEAIKDIRRLFGEEDGETMENDDEEDMSPEIRAWLDQLPKDRNQ